MNTISDKKNLNIQSIPTKIEKLFCIAINKIAIKKVINFLRFHELFFNSKLLALTTMAVSQDVLYIIRASN